MTYLEDKNTFYLVPKEALDDLIQAIRDLKKLQEIVENRKNADTLGDYICEDDAMRLLNRGKTWFWNRRKSGELPGKKAAGRWYYRKSEIVKFVEDGRIV